LITIIVTLARRIHQHRSIHAVLASESRKGSSGLHDNDVSPLTGVQLFVIIVPLALHSLAITNVDALGNLVYVSFILIAPLFFFCHDRLPSISVIKLSPFAFTIVYTNSPISSVCSSRSFSYLYRYHRRGHHPSIHPSIVSHSCSSLLCFPIVLFFVFSFQVGTSIMIFALIWPLVF